MNIEPGSFNNILKEFLTPKTEAGQTAMKEKFYGPQARIEQNEKSPEFIKGAGDIALEACGFTLMATGISATVLLSPVTIPLGLLGAGVALAIGKDYENKEDWVLAGVSIGTLGAGYLAITGARLVQEARNRSSQIPID